MGVPDGRDSLKVLLVWPPTFNCRTVLPIAFAYLKSNLRRPGVDLRMLDGALIGAKDFDPRLDAMLEEFRPDVVGVSAWAHSYPSSLSILARAKKRRPETVTVIGGYHVSAASDLPFDSPHVDYALCGEGEFSFPVFLDAVASTSPDWAGVPGLVRRGRDGALLKNEVKFIMDLDSLIPPDYDFISIEQYFRQGYRNRAFAKRNIPLIATRGCQFRCSFCAAPVTIGRTLRRHSAAYVLDHIRHLYYERDIRWFNFIDDNFLNTVDFPMELCRGIARLNLKGAGFGTPSGVRMHKGRVDLWKTMKEAGWREVFLAPESGSEKVLKKMRKDLKLEIVPSVIREIKEGGLQVGGFFLIGYPEETEEDLEKTIRLIRENDWDYVSLNNFQPIPGTPIYQELIASGEITEDQTGGAYGFGKRVYVPRGLAHVNFNHICNREQILLLARKPFVFLRNIFLANPMHVLTAISSNLKHSILFALKR